MEIRRDQPPAQPAPPQWFEGEVWIEQRAAPTPPARAHVVMVHFAPGARTAWHTHPRGQVIHIIYGHGLVQRRGGAVEHVGAGDTISFAPGEDHWHGASKGHPMGHLAIHERDDDGISVVWGDHVTATPESPSDR